MARSRVELSKKAIVQYALFRWENAIIVAGVILLTAFFPRPFSWWPIWGWVLLGLIGVGMITYSSLTNIRFNAQLLLSAFQDQFDLKRIVLPELRRKVESALEYQRRIVAQVQNQESSILWSRAEDTALQLDEWITNVYRLCLRLDAFERDKLLKEDMTAVPAELDRLKQRLKAESDPQIQSELRQVIESKNQQNQTIQALQQRMKQAELQLEQSLTALATIDSQIRLLDAQDVDSGRSERLYADVREQVSRLNDLIGSINEVYDYNAQFIPPPG
jgi:hypothetical protein